MSRRIAAALACLLAWLAPGPAAWAQAGDAPWSLQAGAEAPVTFRGIANFDQAGGKSAAILYPAPNLGGFIAALITHGILVESQKSAEKQRLQEEADAILKPYRSTLDAFRERDLMQAALALLGPPAQPGLVAAGEAPAGWLVQSAPVFGVTPDRRALVLDNALVLFSPTDRTQPARTLVVRIVSRPLADQDLDAFWNAERGAEIRRETSSMFAHSLQLSLAHARSAAAEAEAPPFRTIRYPEGSAERIERVQVLQRHCERHVVRNLRGWLMSVPMKDDSASDCRYAVAAWK